MNTNAFKIIAEFTCYKNWKNNKPKHVSGEPRNFIQETIDTLEVSKIVIDEAQSKFKNGDLTKDVFEKVYQFVLSNWIKSDIESEIYYPNNSCKYCETVPDNAYFKQENI